ncbi:hypothetical protein PSSM2_300 [Prochlorococcus phage P-SSM2]|uniref:Uncharacterized protein n=2 Tax=Salacisavirus pssm2 TaxID=2734140 RepID=Q58M55_BPPRM|nr:hypothetical protein PSSM2_300 [Prochlorococcus phage P-SSM2]AAX44677.1 hypothetical protein PSSM2_300 [Prochlorococcus phage P-SSM2]ACY76176.1 conserved hypothetical protein [Prochlorococcus phage P-SSM2]AGN12299.1 hypothetical protein PRTG_00146 [Prochlorococcus phage P-SSM5]
MLSGSSGGGGGGLQFGQQDNFTVHALRRDDDGMLRYTKVKTSDPDVVDVSHRLDGTAYPEFLEGLDYVDETTEEKTYKNNDFDKYQQFRFDFRRTSYYIDDDGYLTVSFSDYDYTAGPK